MNSLGNRVKQFFLSEDGPTAVEYAMMLGLVIIVCFAVVHCIGFGRNQTVDSARTELSFRTSVIRKDLEISAAPAGPSSFLGDEGKNDARPRRSIHERQPIARIDRFVLAEAHLENITGK